MPVNIAIDSFVAGILASFACGLGALPLMFPKLDLSKRTGVGYGIAGGLMFSASVYNLLWPGLNMGNSFSLQDVLPVIIGILLGSVFIWYAHVRFDTRENQPDNKKRNLTQVLIFVAMAVHSIPEGVAVGVGYASGEVLDTDLGSYIALAIGIHNIPEGLAISLIMIPRGMRIWTTVFFCIFSVSSAPSRSNKSLLE